MAAKKKNIHENKVELQPQQSLSVSTRGRNFDGFVVKKFPKRVVIETERTTYVPKYERFYKKKMRLHARLPDTISVSLGDLVRVQECRPLSKIIHHIVIAVLKQASESKGSIQ